MCNNIYYPLQEVCSCYWPHQGVTSFGEMEIENIGGSSSKHYTVIAMKITDNIVSFYHTQSVILQSVAVSPNQYTQ